MSKLDWSKQKTGGRRARAHWIKIKEKSSSRWKQEEERFGKTYENGTFYIDRVEIPKYNPRYKSVFIGFYFNQVAGRFEYWKKGGLLDSINWKVGQPLLIEWRKKFL